MSITQILFYFLSVLALGSALMVVISRNPVHSVLWLIATFFAISGHYILMNAQFLGIVNLIVYAGAIMVLFLFVIMLMNLNTETEPKGWYCSRRLFIVGTGSRPQRCRSEELTGAIERREHRVDC
jgi:NADH:ubiquinone oxidoreductase subunit 6 (subunit J)